MEMVLTPEEEEKIYREEYEKTLREKKIEKIREKARRKAELKAEGKLAILKQILRGKKEKEKKPPIAKIREEIVERRGKPVERKILIERAAGSVRKNTLKEIAAGLGASAIHAFTPETGGRKKEKRRRGEEAAGGRFYNPFNGEHKQISQQVSRGFAYVFNPYGPPPRKKRTY